MVAVMYLRIPKHVLVSIRRQMLWLLLCVYIYQNCCTEETLFSMKINVSMLCNIKHVTKILRNKKSGENNFYVIMLNMNKDTDYSKA